jgi:MFS family permease
VSRTAPAAGEPTTAADRRAGRRLPPAFAVTGLLAVGGLYTTIPIADALADRFGVSLGTAALSGTAFGLGYGSGFLGIGVAADRLERRATIAGALAAASAFTLLAGLAGGFAPFLAVRFLAGFCAAGFAPACYAYLSAHIAPEQRAGRFAVITAGFLSAGALGQVYAAAVEPWLGVTGVYVVLAALLALAAGVHRAWLARQPAPPGTESLRAAYAHLGEIVAMPAMRATFPASAVVFVAFVGVYAALGPRIEVEHGLGAGALLQIRALGMPAIVAGGALAALAAGRRAPTTVVRGGLGLIAGGTALAALAPTLVLQVASTLLVAGGIGLTMPTLLA